MIFYIHFYIIIAPNIPNMTKVNKHALIFLFFVCLTFIQCNNLRNKKEILAGSSEKTTFQTADKWKPATNVDADVAIIYGTHDIEGMTFEQRIQSWRDKGYTTHFMTGISWGGYQDYFTGKWDGKGHFDDGQVERNGDTIWHSQLVPYIVPTESYIKYINEKHVKRVIDAGIDAIYMEEPEFWARAGYSESFRREWKKYYGFDWRPQHESPENTYLSNKLKYYLYYNAINKIFTYAKKYGKSKGINVRCYVPTHSLVNYSQWQIISPEASLASLSCVDGYIAQVWTGTSREPSYYNGFQKERVFENAFLEYGSMESMTAPTGRKMFFLTDPIEDRPRDWDDYKKNYQATFIAQLLYPNVANYEVMPWPDRIYQGLYKKSDSNVQERIPRYYSTQMQIMINALNSMPLCDTKVTGTEGINVLMANSLMFQRFPTHHGYEDPQLSNFYGMVLPLLKRGVPVGITHIENVSFPETLKNTKVLIMSYSNMKPISPEEHNYIAGWVKKGGVLVYCGRDKDPFQSVQEWWNTGDNKYEAASDHLFDKMCIGYSPKEGEYSYGNGTVYIVRQDPKEFVMTTGSGQKLVDLVKRLYEQKTEAGKFKLKNNLFIERGLYDIVSVMDESISDTPYILTGMLIDLFDPQLPVLTEKKVLPGEQAFMLNIDRVANKRKPQVLASACRISDERVGRNEYSFISKSPLNTTNSMRVLFPSMPTKCTIINQEGNELENATWEWDEKSKTCLLSFENNPNGVSVFFKWQ